MLRLLPRLHAALCKGCAWSLNICAVSDDVQWPLLSTEMSFRVAQLKKSSVSVLDRLETRAEVGNNDKKKRGESIPTYDVNLYHMG